MKKLLLSIFTIASAILTSYAQCGSLFYDGFETGSPNPAWVPGIGHTMTVNNASPAVGTYNLDLTGNSAHFAGPNATFTAGQPTYISWRVKTGNVTSANAYFVAGDASTSTNLGILFCYITSGSVIRFFGTTGYNYPITVNTWIKVECVNLNWTARTMDIYVNNVLILTAWPFRSTTSTSLDRVFIYNLNSATSNYDEIIVNSGNPLSSSSTSQNVLCNGANNGSATVTPIGGTAPFTYNWAPSGGTNATATGLAPNTYTCTITDAASCTSTQTVTITEPAVLTAAPSQTNVLCNGANNGTATVTASGGTPGYTYNWAPSGGTAATATGLAPTSYTCTITDANNCTATQTFTITEPTALSSSATNVDVDCFGNATGSITVTVSGGTPAYTYSWAPSGGTSAAATGLTAGTYTCYVTDANNCTFQTAVTVNQPSALTANATATAPTFCTGGCTNISVTETGGTSPYTYVWMPGSLTNATENVCPTSTTTYTVTVTDANNCTQTATATVTINSLPVISYVQSPTMACFNWAAFALSAATPSGGTYSGPGVTVNMFDPATAGLGTWNIVYTYTDVNGCTDSVTQQITVDLCTGIQNASLNSNTSAYPNPFNDFIFISGIETNAEVKIINVLGEMVYGTANYIPGTSINTQQFPAGIYFVEIKTENGTAVKKIVKE